MENFSVTGVKDRDPDTFDARVNPVYVIPMDDIKIEIGEDVHGHIYARTVSGTSSWLSCVGLEFAIARELLRVVRGFDRAEKG